MVNTKSDDTLLSIEIRLKELKEDLESSTMYAVLVDIYEELTDILIQLHNINPSPYYQSIYINCKDTTLGLLAQMKTIQEVSESVI